MNSSHSSVHDNNDKARIERWKFLKLSILVEGGLSIVALVTGWALGLPVWTNMTLSWEAIGWGVIATVPLLITLRWTYFSQSRGLEEIHQILLDLLGKSLVRCGWLDLCLVATLAGVSEECLFRGVLEPLLGRWNSIFGLLAGNVIFGLCHAVTPTYFLYAALIGCYLSLTLRWTTEPNLVVPITVHALYDLVAFVLIRNEYLDVESRKEYRPHPESGIGSQSEESPQVLDP